MICGGVVREKVMGQLKKMEDLDLTNGESSIKNLAKEVEIELSQRFKVESKIMDDGHSSIFAGNLKIDFSSNFIVHNIDQELQKLGVKKITNLIRETYSRDFTINSLLLDLNMSKVSDPTGKGLDDIKNKIIRTCLSPELTLTSNVNRIIRVIYLAAKLDFNIDQPIIDFISKNKELIKKIDNAYLTKTLNKAIGYNVDKTASVLDTLGLWKSLPITEGLYPHYAKRFIKTAQLRKNFDYGEGFYANLQTEKSVGDFRKKRKKKQKKQIKRIKDMKLK